MNCEYSEFIGKVKSIFPTDRTELIPNINDYTLLMSHPLYQKVYSEIISTTLEEEERAMLTRLLMKSMASMGGKL
jgi:hypothetical protein